ncbi:MAG: glutamate synthase large subunit [Oligoflexales bacterium]
MKQWLDTYVKNAHKLATEGLYDPNEEHSSCGVGLIASLTGKSSREVVEAGIQGLQRISHRGAVDADGKTGDGAGIHIEIPRAFFEDQIKKTGHEMGVGKLAVGMIFLPRTDYEAQERCRSVVESELLKFDFQIYGWRQVPTQLEVIGVKAKATRPEIEQIMVSYEGEPVSPERLEAVLYLIRRRIEKRVLAENLQNFYICSLSSESIIYKGMFMADQLTAFYPDLLDERFTSKFAIYHQRYSTNTFPTWSLAQPFRVIAHNGEINTIRGNIQWMKSHEAQMAGAQHLNDDELKDIVPVIQGGLSDSGSLDSVFELLVHGGRSLPMAKTVLIPDTWTYRASVHQAYRDLYAYCNAIMQPWDGPAAIAGFHAPWVVTGMDRNGLRPLRYAVTSDGLLSVGSETGLLDWDAGRVIEKGRVGPGQMIAVNLHTGTFYRDEELKTVLAQTQDFSSWVQRIKHLGEITGAFNDKSIFSSSQITNFQRLYNWTLEDLEVILRPMVLEAKEAVGSMGDDSPLAVLSDTYRGLHHFFRQNFAQVTNPPIDSLRERSVMSLKTRIGRYSNLLDESEKQCELIELESPVLIPHEWSALKAYLKENSFEVDCTFRLQTPSGKLKQRLQHLCTLAEINVRRGATHVFLTDRWMDENNVPIPMVLAVGAIHSHLVKKQLRSNVSIHVESGESLSVHNFAVLIGVGATTCCPTLAFETIRQYQQRGDYGDSALEQCWRNYKQAINEGLLKIMSKLGISVLSSYCGGYNFEAVGLSRSLVSRYFPGMLSRISGIGLSGVELKIRERHEKVYSEPFKALEVGGFYRYRSGQGQHGLEADAIHMLQTAVGSQSYNCYKRYLKLAKGPEPMALRDLLAFRSFAKPVSLERVESITAIRQRFVIPGMSLGALSPEAHRVLAIAANRMGVKSCSGEGGEHPRESSLTSDGESFQSKIKQIASGRFGVTARYLLNGQEIEIKVAQGAKPGEGGQLPGFKVTDEIAKLRHSTPGVTLISPPPHHDIYSIEDLAQLIYDLKQINPEAEVGVKLVARSGVGTIAVGVAKAMADTISISGHTGGTGASPQSSIKFAGVPWEMGLAEAHQLLTLNGLRDRVKLRVDGGLKTGRDIVIAAILGGEEFGIGTASLVAMGCLIVRQCHKNTCPVGICTQNPKLRERFAGTPEKVINLFSFMAEEVREILASLGATRLDDVIGRTELLEQVSHGSPYLDNLDLNPLLVKAESENTSNVCSRKGRNEVVDTLDSQMIDDVKMALTRGEKRILTYNVLNTHRAVGTRISSLILEHYGNKEVPDEQITLQLKGSAGQSLGAFAAEGLRIEVVGEAHDYVGKGLSGGLIVVRPTFSLISHSQANTIIGNTALYGATSGQLFAAGRAGDRFAVRNSGAKVVVEGCGNNGCEYMTGGIAVILGDVGDNFAAGMTGGVAFVFDPEQKIDLYINQGSITKSPIASLYWERHLKHLIQDHIKYTGSFWATTLLENWAQNRRLFHQIIPNEVLEQVLEQGRSLETFERHHVENAIVREPTKLEHVFQ